jgi:internalin A
MNICLIILLAIPVQGDQTIKVSGEVATPIEGLGTEENPYRYLIDQNSKVAWKHLIDNHNNGVTEVYEYREGQKIDGNLVYSYTFHAQDILTNASGPYFLGIRIYDQEAVKGLPGYPNAMFFSFATKRDFPGKVKVTLNVGDKFPDKTKLNLTYYGGYDSTVIHGPAPVVAKDEIRQIDSNIVQIANELTIINGMVTFDVRYGGNYVLHEEPIDFSGFGIGEVIHYDADKVLGSICSVFPTEKIAQTIASTLGKKTGDTITQGDLDSIKSLYLSSIGLKSIEELERVCFSRLESLVLSENELESLNSLSMPSLTYLDVSGNHLKSVNALAKLDMLENVDLSDNDLISLPDLNKLVNLQTLDLRNNHLQVIPALESNALRYLDLSGNSIVWVAGDLKKCTSLDTVVVVGQVFNTESEMNEREDFYLKPTPRFISQFGNGGRVIITDSRGKKIYEEDFSTLKGDKFCLKGDLFEKSDQYTVTVTGTVLQEGLEEKLGTYTYKLIAGSGSPETLGIRKIIAFGVLVILLGLIIGLVLHARKQKKRNEENK